MVNFIFSLSLLAELVIIGLLLLSIGTGKFQFFPPPKRPSWQYSTFWWLYRIVLLGIVALSFMDFNGLGVQNYSSRFYIGTVFAILGFFLAFLITFELGWKNAHGEAKGLKTKGWYAWSRNPIYLVSIIGFIGWAVAINSVYVYVLYALLIIFYIVTPFLEEPWLEKQYGDRYLEYKADVARFFSIQKFRNQLNPQR